MCLMEILKMIVKKQKKIKFINDCNAIVDYNELEEAILWHAKKPVTSVKHIYMYGSYPAVSIHEEKIHIHRLMMMYWLNAKIPSEFIVHHLNENKLDVSKENLCVVLGSAHASKHNKGKEVSDAVRERLIEFNRSRKNTRQPNRRSDVKFVDVKRLYDKGYSLNKIAKELGCDWSTVRSRLQDIFDNPELLEGGATNE